MRLLIFLVCAVMAAATLSAQSVSETARAAHLANAAYIYIKQDGIGRLMPNPTSTEAGTIRYDVDLSVMGGILPNYLGYKGATAVLEDGKFKLIRFDNGVELQYRYEDGELNGIGTIKTWTWEGDKPTLMSTLWGPTSVFKKFDFVRTIVEIKYDGNNISTLKGISELAKAKSLEKIKKAQRMENFRADYTYDASQQITTVALKTYEIKKGAYTPVLSQPFRYSVQTFAARRRIVYKMANGKAEIAYEYDSKGRKKRENATYRFMGYVNNVTTYTYEGDQRLAHKQVMKVYSKDKRISSVVTDNYKVDYSNPKRPKRTYTGGERHDKTGKKIGERRKGEERRLNPDGSWGQWRKSKQVGQ